MAQAAVAVQNTTQINTVETADPSNMHLIVATSQGTAVTMGQETVDTYHKQFHQYTYYYGEEAARKYYGAWSPQQGTPNSYGTNPKGIAAPPQSQAPAPAAAATTAILAASVQRLLDVVKARNKKSINLSEEAMATATGVASAPIQD